MILGIACLIILLAPSVLVENSEGHLFYEYDKNGYQHLFWISYWKSLVALDSYTYDTVLDNLG